MNKFDLQIQSTASDGKYQPRELVNMANGVGLSVIALTDHDTVGGVEEALLAGGGFGIRVIPGIELSVEERGVHILGYGIDYKNDALLDELEKFKLGRIEGAKKMVENLKKSGFVVEWQDVVKEAAGGVVGRPHLAHAVLGRPENKGKLGSVSTVHEFITTHLADGGPNYVKRTHISAKDAISLIHQAGGVAIWSHPAIHFTGDYDGLEKFLQDLLGWGLDGIEVFNASHTEDDIEFLEGLAAKFRILRTAGSDFHEGGNESGVDPTTGLHSARTVGDYETYGFSTEGIVAALDEAIKNRREAASRLILR